MNDHSFFMRDQVRDRVSSLMAERTGEVTRQLGGPVVTLLIVALTLLNVMAVSPGG